MKDPKDNQTIDAFSQPDEAYGYKSALNDKGEQLRRETISRLESELQTLQRGARRVKGKLRRLGVRL